MLKLATLLDNLTFIKSKESNLKMAKPSQLEKYNRSELHWCDYEKVNVVDSDISDIKRRAFYRHLYLPNEICWKKNGQTYFLSDLDPFRQNLMVGKVSNEFFRLLRISNVSFCLRVKLLPGENRYGKMSWIYFSLRRNYVIIARLKEQLGSYLMPSGIVLARLNVFLKR